MMDNLMKPVDRSKKQLMAVLTVVSMGLALFACSSSGDSGDEGANNAATPTVLPATGDQCQDDVGDLSSDVKAAGVGTDPPGIDLVSASASLQDDDTLDITFTTAGPITDTEGTAFIVAQGSAGSPLGFEIRATSKGGGTWGITAVTWSPAEKTVSVPVSPIVSGNSISFTVPMESLPPLALYLQFGSTTDVAGVGQVIDDCSSLTTAPTVSTG
jgi:hypothetical protein